MKKLAIPYFVSMPSTNLHELRGMICATMARASQVFQEPSLALESIVYTCRLMIRAGYPVHVVRAVIGDFPSCPLFFQQL